MTTLARTLILLGLLLIALGGSILLFNRLNIPWGHLPGDIRWEGEHGSCIIALGSSLLLSLILTVLLNLLVRWLNR